MWDTMRIVVRLWGLAGRDDITELSTSEVVLNKNFFAPANCQHQLDGGHVAAANYLALQPVL